MDPIFNGGKMQHLFSRKMRTYTNRFYQLVLSKPTEEAANAAENGTIYLKIDGSNGRIDIDKTGKIECYRRFYDKKNVVMHSIDDTFVIQNGFKLLLDGVNNDHDRDKKYYMNYMDLRTFRKKELKIWTEIYRIAQTALERGDLEPGHQYSVEYVGQKFNSTPCVLSEIGIALHRQQVIHEKLETLEDFEQFFLRNAVEGVVIEHDGRWWKMRSDGFASCRKSSHAWCTLEKMWKCKKSLLKQQWAANNELEDFRAIPPRLL